MNSIAQLLSTETILLDLDVASKKRVFEQVGLLFENVKGIGRAQVFDSLFAREKLGSTALGQGVAIPHGRIKTLKSAVAAFVRVKAPIPFDAPDAKPVSHIYVLLVPEHATDEHLQILSELAQLFGDKQFREELSAATDPLTVKKLFAEWVPM